MPGSSSGPATKAPSDEGDDDADRADQRGADADADQIAEPGFEADLQQQDDDPQFGHEHDDRVAGDGVEIVEAEQAEIAEHDAEQQFAEHGGKADLLGERREEAGGEQDEGQPQQVLADHVAPRRED